MTTANVEEFAHYQIPTPDNFIHRLSYKELPPAEAYETPGFEHTDKGTSVLYGDHLRDPIPAEFSKGTRDDGHEQEILRTIKAAIRAREQSEAEAAESSRLQAMMIVGVLGKAAIDERRSDPAMDTVGDEAAGLTPWGQLFDAIRLTSEQSSKPELAKDLVLS